MCIEYNAGNQSTGDTTTYSKYLAWGFSFRDNASGSSNRYYHTIGNLSNSVSGGGTHKLEISSSTKTSYNRYITGSYGAIRLNVGGWDSDRTHSSDDSDEYWVYYNSGYITAVWLEE